MDMAFNTSNLAPIVPEVFLAIAVLGFLVLGVFGGNRTTPLITYGVILTLVAAGILIHIDPNLSAMSGSPALAAWWYPTRLSRWSKCSSSPVRCWC